MHVTKIKKLIQVPRSEKSSVKPERNLTAALKIHTLAAHFFHDASCAYHRAHWPRLTSNMLL